MRIETNGDRCIGAGQCVLTAPDLFDQDDAGIVEVLAQPGQARLAAAREAVAACPAAAIRLTGPAGRTGRRSTQDSARDDVHPIRREAERS